MTTLSMGSVEMFSSQTEEPGMKARALAAALLAQSDINDDNYAHVEAVLTELVTLGGFAVGEED